MIILFRPFSDMTGRVLYYNPVILVILVWDLLHNLFPVHVAFFQLFQQRTWPSRNDTRICISQHVVQLAIFNHLVNYISLRRPSQRSVIVYFCSSRIA